MGSAAAQDLVPGFLVFTTQEKVTAASLAPSYAFGWNGAARTLSLFVEADGDARAVTATRADRRFCGFPSRQKRRLVLCMLPCLAAVGSGARMARYQLPSAVSQPTAARYVA